MPRWGPDCSARASVRQLVAEAGELRAELEECRDEEFDADEGADTSERAHSSLVHYADDTTRGRDAEV